MKSIPAADGQIPSEYHAESQDFVVRSYRGGPGAERVLRRCSSLREHLQSTWLGESAPEPWKPRCEIVLHATRASYAQAVGRGAGRTNGSSLIRFKRNEIAQRRIDLVVNDAGETTALPHELTHVVLADRFAGRQPPRWADEGIAMLADSKTKQSLHHDDCMAAIKSGTALRVIDLLRLEQFTSAEQVPAFYGQSLSLARFLVERDDPSQFVPFLELAMSVGYDRALREIYHIEDILQLEVHWHRFAVAPLAPTRLESVAGD